MIAAFLLVAFLALLSLPVYMLWRMWSEGRLGDFWDDENVVPMFTFFYGIMLSSFFWSFFWSVLS